MSIKSEMRKSLLQKSAVQEDVTRRVIGPSEEPKTKDTKPPTPKRVPIPAFPIKKPGKQLLRDLLQAADSSTHRYTNPEEIKTLLKDLAQAVEDGRWSQAVMAMCKESPEEMSLLHQRLSSGDLFLLFRQATSPSKE